MIAQVTHGIKVSVSTKFLENQSKTELSYYLFAYKIKIENNSEFAVQVLSRHWVIFDSSSEVRVVEGKGVVGEQPVIAPGEFYEYESACDLATDMGSMHGTYHVERKIDGKAFHISIPRFELVDPKRLN